LLNKVGSYPEHILKTNKISSLCGLSDLKPIAIEMIVPEM
jgi:hypothetical protein